MATLLEREDHKIELQDGDELGTFDEVEAAASDETAPTPQPESIPDKYVGKTPAELIAMHQEAERFNGKQSTEVGELRKSVDSLIQAQLATATPAPAEAIEEDPIDFFENPEAAVNKAIQNHPDVQRAQQEAARYRQQTATAQLIGKHPDMQALLADEAFLGWVGESNIRTRLFREAHSNYDTEAADELFSTWKEKQGIVAATAEVEKKERKQAVREANTGDAPASSAGTPRKIYRRADVIRLMNDDPDRYLALSNEIMAAYAEGRVVS